MRVASLVAYALLALAGVHSVSAQDTDEFDGVEPPAITPPEEADTLPLDFSVITEAEHDYLLEGGSLAVAAFYVINYFVGKSQNKKIANKWLEGSEPSLVKEFAYTGASAEPRVGLLEESKNNFKYYCTGRRFCSRLVADLNLASRHDLFTRLFHIVLPSKDYLTLNVGLNATDLDPIVFGVVKKLQYNALTKSFPELISVAKRQDTSQIPDTFCIASDNIETPKTALTSQLIKQIKALEPFLEFFVITDMNTLPVVGFPKSERRVLRMCFKLRDGSKELDAAAAVALMAYLIDAIGSTMKLSRDLKASAQKKRAKLIAQRPASEDTISEQERRLNELKEKKRLEYEAMSYEEKQKYDEIHQNRQVRKRTMRKQK